MNRTGTSVVLTAALACTMMTACGDGRYRAGDTAEVQHTAEAPHTMNTNDKPVIPVETTTESTATTTRTTRVTTVTRRTAGTTSVTEPRTEHTDILETTAVTEESDLLDRAESALESAGDAVTGVLTDATRPVPPIR